MFVGKVERLSNLIKIMCGREKGYEGEEKAHGAMEEA